MPGFFFFCTLVCLALLCIGVFKPRTVLRGESRTRAKAAKLYGAAAFAFFFAFVLTLPKPVKTPALQESKQAAVAGAGVAVRSADKGTVVDKPSEKAIGTDPASQLTKKLAQMGKEFDNTIAEVSPGGKYRVQVTYRPGAIWSESSYVNTLANELWNIGKTVHASGLPIQSLTLHGFAPTKDKYGNEGISKAMTLTIREQDFSKVNWKNIDQFALLDLADASLTPLGRHAVAEYCGDRSNFKLTREFCDTATQARRP